MGKKGGVEQRAPDFDILAVEMEAVHSGVLQRADADRVVVRVEHAPELREDVDGDSVQRRRLYRPELQPRERLARVGDHGCACGDGDRRGAAGANAFACAVGDGGADTRCVLTLAAAEEEDGDDTKHVICVMGQCLVRCGGEQDTHWFVISAEVLTVAPPVLVTSSV